MTARWRWALGQITRRVWFRASLFSILAVATAFLGIWLDPIIPDDIPGQIGARTVDNLLGIIASSMLTVTTFSLSIMVAAYSAATSNVTPRATKLIMEDSTTQNVLSTFIGSFIFSLVGIIVLSTGAYGDRGRVVLFAVTILVIVFIVVTLLRWIDHLSRLGRVTETTQRVEEAAARAMRERRDSPYLGGRGLLDATAVPKNAVPVFATMFGYIQHIDIAALSAVAEGSETDVYLQALPGAFVDPTRPIALCSGPRGDDLAGRILDCFTIGDVRSFDQDPRFGLSVLTEIGSRALSTSINDPGTAIDVVGRALRTLAIFTAEPNGTVEITTYQRIHVPPLLVPDLFEDAFGPLARDGAALLELGIRLQKAFLTLTRLGREDFAAEARRHSRLALARAERELVLDEDKAILRALAADVAASGR